MAAGPLYQELMGGACLLAARSLLAAALTVWTAAASASAALRELIGHLCLQVSVWEVPLLAADISMH